MISPNPGLRLLLSVLGGGIMTLAFPPFGWEPAALVATIGLLWLAASSPSWKSALWSGYLFGLTFFSTLLWWLTTVELIGYLPLVLVSALSFLIVAGIVYFFRNSTPPIFVLAAVGSWALVEFLRVRVPVGGFPWGLLGHTVSSTPLRPASQWFGATGWTVLLVTVAATATLVLLRRISWQSIIWPVAVVVLIGLAGTFWPATAQGPSQTVTIVQGNSPCPPATRCPGERWAIYQNHLNLTQSLAPHADLVVWAESSLGGPADPLTNQEVRSSIGEQAARLGAHMLVGGDLGLGEERFMNVNLFFTPDGQLAAQYTKRHPVPFGEYVPFRNLLDWIPAISRVPRDMVRGQEPVQFDLDGAVFGSVISYEGAFARYGRQLVKNGSQFLVVATNQSSFGESPVSDQFLAITRLRAAELGVDIVHAAITGKSAIVHADGSVIGPTGLNEATTLTGEINSRQAGLTLYAWAGDWLQVAALLALIGFAIHRLARLRRA